MNFGQAIEALKLGKSVARNGWNGKGMCIYLNLGSFDGEPSNVTNEDLEWQRFHNKIHGSTLEGVSLSLFTVGDTGTVTRLPNINMKTPTGSTVTGWLASQTDMLAEDWTILE